MNFNAGKAGVRNFVSYGKHYPAGSISSLWLEKS